MMPILKACDPSRRGSSTSRQGKPQAASQRRHKKWLGLTLPKKAPLDHNYAANGWAISTAPEKQCLLPISIARISNLSHIDFVTTLVVEYMLETA